MKTRSLAERFWEKVSKGTPCVCWPWTARKTGNYGSIGAGGKYGRSLYAHRVAWELTNGPIPAGMYVLHRCDNPPCCNPRHLFLGTAADNLADMDRKGRRVVWHPTGELNPGGGKLSADDVVFAREWVGAGWSRASVASALGVSGVMISNIVRRVSWAHV